MPDDRPDPAQSFAQAGQWFVDVLRDLPEARWAGPGLGQWSLRSLVGHTTRALLTVSDYLANAVPGTEEPEIGDPAGYFLRAATLAGPDAVAARGVTAGQQLGADPRTAVRTARAGASTRRRCHARRRAGRPGRAPARLVSTGPLTRATMTAMTSPALAEALDKMRSADMSETAVAVFARYWHELQGGATGTIAEDEIEPLEPSAALGDLDSDADTEALAHTAVVKLNGGLGTSMGMDRAKSLLPVRGDDTFLDLIVQQVRSARRVTGARLPLVLMHSFSTRDDCLAALAAYPDLAVPGVELDFLQSQEPKLRADDLSPVQWSDDPALEWCPPGHGDLYPSLLSSGMLDALIEAGFRYAFVSNSDNLGASPSVPIADWFASCGAPFAMEVCRRTAADRKGGHLAVRTADGRLVLRETAQVREEDQEAYSDVERHRYFSTNNLWLRLDALREVLHERDGVLGLPLIRNHKTVDPRDPDSTPVIQVESAMGAAIQVFDDATAIEVPRTRFRPVKTTDDLLLLRSDAFEGADDGTLEATVDPLPLVTLSKTYKRIADFDERFPRGAPSLRDAESLTVEGDWTFGADVEVHGAVHLEDTGEPQQVSDDRVLDASA